MQIRLEMLAPDSSSPLSKLGTSFIRQRYLEEWDIVRNDVTPQLVAARWNVVASDTNNSVFGWLGIEPDWELTNGCVDPSLPGVRWLEIFIRIALLTLPSDSYYGWVPVDNPASAIACARAVCGKIKLGPEEKIESYQGTEIKLIKIRLHAARPLSTKDIKRHFEKYRL